MTSVFRAQARPRGPRSVLSDAGLRRGAAPVARGILSAPFALTRTQAAGVEVAVPGPGGVFTRVPANTARFDGRDRGLVLEGARTNLCPNPRTVGGVGWTNTGIASAVATTGPDGAADSAVLLNEGTATSGHLTTFGTANVTAGTAYVFSIFVAAGTTSLVQITDLSAGFGGGHTVNFDLSGAGSSQVIGGSVTAHGMERFGEWWRLWVAGAAVANSAAAGFGVCFIQALNSVRAVSFAGTSRTLRVAWPQLEAATRPTAVVLPPVGAPASVVRGDDVLTAPLASFGIGETGSGVYEATVVMPQSAPAGAAQSVLEVEADANNRFLVRVAAGGNAVSVNRVTAGAAAGDTSAGNMTPGVPFTIRLTLPGDGTASLSLNGGAAVSVSGGPVTNLATLRVGNNSAAGTPMNGRLLALNVRASSRDARLAVPPGFPWAPPFSVFRSPDGTYRHDFNPALYAIQGKTYYVSPTGNDANSGLSWAAAKRSLSNVFATVPDYDVVLVAAGEYDLVSGWNGQAMNRSASVIAVGGRAVFTRRASVTWTPHGVAPVWLSSAVPVSAPGLVTDGAVLGPTGLPTRLIRAASLAACETTPGSFFPSGTQVYVHLTGGRAPDTNVTVYVNGLNADIGNGVSGYFRDLDFLGGFNNMRSVHATAGAARTVVWDNCNFRFATTGDSIRLETNGNWFFSRCIAEMAEMDGFNYRPPSGGGAGPNVAELDCIARWNGYTTSGFNNGTTLHGGNAVSVSGLYERNQDRNVHDVFTNSFRWAAGCTSRDSRSAGASKVNWSVGQIAGQAGDGQAVSLWLDGGLSSGSTTDLEVNAAGTARDRNTATGGWVIVNNGTRGAY